MSPILYDMAELPEVLRDREPPSGRHNVVSVRDGTLNEHEIRALWDLGAEVRVSLIVPPGRAYVFFDWGSHERTL